MRAGAATGRGVGSCGSRRGGSGRSSLGGRDPRGRTPFRGESAAGHERVCRGGAQPPAGSYSNFFDPRGSIPYGYVAAGVRCSTKAGAHTVAWGERTRPHASGRHLLPRLPPRSTGKAGGYIRTARSPVLLIRAELAGPRRALGASWSTCRTWEALPCAWWPQRWDGRGVSNRCAGAALPNRCRYGSKGAGDLRVSTPPPAGGALWAPAPRTVVEAQPRHRGAELSSLDGVERCTSYTFIAHLGRGCGQPGHRATEATTESIFLSWSGGEREKNNATSLPKCFTMAGGSGSRQSYTETRWPLAVQEGNKLRGRRDSKVFHSMPARPVKAATAAAKTHEATAEMQRKEHITNQKQTSKTRKK